MIASASALLATEPLKIWHMSPAVDEQAAVFPGDIIHSHESPSHHQRLAHGQCVMENLVLDDVPEGNYEWIALLLKLMRADASPVRPNCVNCPLTPALFPQGRGRKTDPGNLPP